MQSKNLDAESPNKEQVIVADCPTLPLVIDGELTIRSLVNIAHKITVKIIGASHGEYILIKEPVLQINDRLSVVFEDNFLCLYFHAGYAYVFKSKRRHTLPDDLISIEYPYIAEIRQIRKYRRIKVNIETELTSPELISAYTGDMMDISTGGCCLKFPSSVRLTSGKDVYLQFHLPNDQKIKGLKSRIMSVKHDKGSDSAEIGLSFLGPPSESDKVAEFCEFCMFFELE